MKMTPIMTTRNTSNAMNATNNVTEYCSVVMHSGMEDILRIVTYGGCIDEKRTGTNVRTEYTSTYSGSSSCLLLTSRSQLFFLFCAAKSVKK